VKRVLPLAILLFVLAPLAYSNCNTIDIIDEGIGGWTKGVAGSYQLTPCCGTAPYTFTLSSGAFVPGVSMNSSGLISGTPTACDINGYTACVTVTDSLGCHVTKCFNQQVQCS